MIKAQKNVMFQILYVQKVVYDDDPVARHLLARSKSEKRFHRDYFIVYFFLNNTFP